MLDTLGGPWACDLSRGRGALLSLGCSFTSKATFGGLEGDPAAAIAAAGGASVKRISAHGGCLGTNRRRRTWQAAKSLGELQASIDPGMSEWGNPARVVPRHSFRGEPTGGTETSQYPEEEKSNEIP